MDSNIIYIPIEEPSTPSTDQVIELNSLIPTTPQRRESPSINKDLNFQFDKFSIENTKETDLPIPSCSAYAKENEAYSESEELETSTESVVTKAFEKLSRSLTPPKLVTLNDPEDDLNSVLNKNLNHVRRAYSMNWPRVKETLESNDETLDEDSPRKKRKFSDANVLLSEDSNTPSKKRKRKGSSQKKKKQMQKEILSEDSETGEPEVKIRILSENSETEELKMKKKLAHEKCSVPEELISTSDEKHVIKVEESASWQINIPIMETPEIQRSLRRSSSRKQNLEEKTPKSAIINRNNSSSRKRKQQVERLKNVKKESADDYLLPNVSEILEIPVTSPQAESSNSKMRFKSIKKTSKLKNTRSTDSRSAVKEITDPIYRKPFNFGWQRELVYRQKKSSGQIADVYYYTKEKKKIRSLKAIKQHLEGTSLTIDNFTFKKKPLGVNDTNKEIIRNVYRKGSKHLKKKKKLKIDDGIVANKIVTIDEDNKKTRVTDSEHEENDQDVEEESIDKISYIENDESNSSNTDGVCADYSQDTTQFTPSFLQMEKDTKEINADIIKINKKSPLVAQKYDRVKKISCESFKNEAGEFSKMSENVVDLVMKNETIDLSRTKKNISPEIKHKLFDEISSNSPNPHQLNQISSNESMLKNKYTYTPGKLESSTNENSAKSKSPEKLHLTSESSPTSSHVDNIYLDRSNHLFKTSASRRLFDNDAFDNIELASISHDNTIKAQQSSSSSTEFQSTTLTEMNESIDEDQNTQSTLISMQTSTETPTVIERSFSSDQSESVEVQSETNLSTYLQLPGSENLFNDRLPSNKERHKSSTMCIKTRTSSVPLLEPKHKKIKTKNYTIENSYSELSKDCSNEYDMQVNVPQIESKVTNTLPREFTTEIEAIPPKNIENFENESNTFASNVTPISEEQINDNSAKNSASEEILYDNVLKEDKCIYDATLSQTMEESTVISENTPKDISSSNIAELNSTKNKSYGNPSSSCNIASKSVKNKDFPDIQQLGAKKIDLDSMSKAKSPSKKNLDSSLHSNIKGNTFLSPSGNENSQINNQFENQIQQVFSNQSTITTSENDYKNDKSYNEIMKINEPDKIDHFLSGLGQMNIENKKLESTLKAGSSSDLNPSSSLMEFENSLIRIDNTETLHPVNLKEMFDACEVNPCEIFEPNISNNINIKSSCFNVAEYILNNSKQQVTRKENSLKNQSTSISPQGAPSNENIVNIGSPEQSSSCKSNYFEDQSEVNSTVQNYVKTFRTPSKSIIIRACDSQGKFNYSNINSSGKSLNSLHIYDLDKQSSMEITDVPIASTSNMQAKKLTYFTCTDPRTSNLEIEQVDASSVSGSILEIERLFQYTQSEVEQVNKILESGIENESYEKPNLNETTLSSDELNVGNSNLVEHNPILTTENVCDNGVKAKVIVEKPKSTIDRNLSDTSFKSDMNLNNFASSTIRSRSSVSALFERSISQELDSSKIKRMRSSSPLPISIRNPVVWFITMHSAFKIIFGYLEVRDLFAVKRVCKTWKEFIEAPLLWKKLRISNGYMNLTLAEIFNHYKTEHIIVVEDDPKWKKFTDAIKTIPSLRILELRECPAFVLEEVGKNCPHLKVITTRAIKGDILNTENLENLHSLEKMQLRSMNNGISVMGDFTFLCRFDRLTHLSLRSIKNLGRKNIDVIQCLKTLQDLELGECSQFLSTFGMNTLGELKNLKRLRMEKIQGSCCSTDILTSVSKLEKLTELELIEIEIKSTLEEDLSKCKNILKLILVPSYENRSRNQTTRQEYNEIILKSISELSATLKCFIWGVTEKRLELPNVTFEFVSDGALASNSLSQTKLLEKLIMTGNRHTNLKDADIIILPVMDLEKLLAGVLSQTQTNVTQIPASSAWNFGM